MAWFAGAFVAASVMWAWTNWAGRRPVGLCRDHVDPSYCEVSITTPTVEIAKVEAIATWTEQIRDTMNASAGLQQSLVATASNGPTPIRSELANFARRAPRGDLSGALRQLGADLNHPAADLVIVWPAECHRT